MSYKARAVAEREAEPAPDYRCPAHGCPNAASVSLDHGARWSCYAHSRAPGETWPQVTQQIRSEWPASANWSHPEKLKHDAEQAAKRRAALPARPKASMGLSMADALGMARS